MRPTYTCASCGGTVTGSHRVRDGEHHCTDCVPMSGGSDGDAPVLDVRGGVPDEFEAHRAAEWRRRVIENAANQRGRF